MDPAFVKLLQGIGGPAAASPDMAEKAQKFMQMLDDMAESDPEQYKAFIKQQAESAKADMAKCPRQKPSLILHVPVQPDSSGTTQQSASRVSLFEIAENQDRASSRPCTVVISLFPAADQQVCVDGKRWHAKHGFVPLSRAGISFKVRQILLNSSAHSMPLVNVGPVHCHVSQRTHL